MTVNLKVYGNIYPATKQLHNSLLKIVDDVTPYASNTDIPIIELENDLLRISFEGSYFPDEEVIAVIEQQLTTKQQGKLDVLNISEWHIKRYMFNDGQITSREASLNQVLDYSGF